MNLDFAPGDLLELHWVGLTGKPRALYQIVVVTGTDVWYYAMGSSKLSTVPKQTFEDGQRDGTFTISAVTRGESSGSSVVR